MALENTHYGYARIERLMQGCRSVFFIGIGGISMSSLAEMTRRAGYLVGGSDRSENAQTLSLKRQGIPVFSSHAAENVADYDAVVYTVAIGSDNPELLAAATAGKPIFSRADYLGYLMMAYKTRIGVSGMHGKSTCTAMCAQIFLEAADPTVLCGAQLQALGNSTFCMGREREHMIFEACEYMDSFLDFNPTLAIILNVGLDHVDYFENMEQIRASFLHFAERVGKGGTVLYNADDKETQAALVGFAGKRVTFGLDASADFTARALSYHNAMTEFDFYRGEELICHIRLRAYGRHNIYNALAAASAAMLCGISPAQIATALSVFEGARRRMEYKGTLSGAAVYDDYAHHPDEIRATLSGALDMGYDRVLCAYQPHTYSRTAGLFEEFSAAFGACDRVYFADIYAAREQNIFGVSSEQLAEKIGERAEYCGSLSAVADAIRRDARPGDLVIIMGAGDIYKVFGLLGFVE